MEIKQCPCGETPTELFITDAGQGAKWAHATGNCCGEWEIEFRTGYNDFSSDECMDFAVQAWNETPRDKRIAELEQELTEVKAHNALLLEDKNASPAIIAGYRDYNTSLIEQVDDLKLHLEDDAENQAIEFARAIEEPYYISDNGGEGGKFIRLSVYNDLKEQLAGAGSAINQIQPVLDGLEKIALQAEEIRIRGERMERMFRNLPLKLQVYLKDMGEFDDDGKAL